MSDPTYEVYSGTMRFDDDNIVDVNLQPDTENINVRLNGTEVTIGAELPAVTAADNGDVLTVVEGAWAKAEPASQLPSVSGSDNGNLLTVVEGAWAKAAPASQLPAVSGSDNGNVLTVVEGAWAKAAAPSGLPAVSASDNGDVLKVVAGAWAKSTENILILTESYSGTTATLSETFQTIYDAAKNGKIVKILSFTEDSNSGSVTYQDVFSVSYTTSSGTYAVSSSAIDDATGEVSAIVYNASSASDYPSYTFE